jgi:hypothetical protein
MKCEEAESYLIDYIENTLDENLREELEKHLEGCERCLDRVKDFKQMLTTIGSSAEEQPDESLRINFYHMLHREVHKQGPERIRIFPARWTTYLSKHGMKYAAGIALLIAGMVTGMLLASIVGGGEEKAQLSRLNNEVKNMKDLLILSMLKEESPSQRIQAVDYTEGIQAPDFKILEALITTLNNDKNVNVRMAAAYSLARYADNESVRDSLVESLSRQTEPIIQVVLINILVEKKENRAIKPLQQIISNEKTLKDVKEVAQKGVEVLL